MDQIAIYGIGAYWKLKKEDAYKYMQKDLIEKFQFFKSLIELNSTIEDNKEFINLVKGELLTANVYVNTPKGEVIELPKGATALDFAYKLHSNIGNNMSYALVNNKKVRKDYVLKNNDRVKIIVDENAVKPTLEWLDIVKTTQARNKIRDYFKK
ncbi:MAG: TGS domain-containing protein [Clostridia bacterium]